MSLDLGIMRVAVLTTTAGDQRRSQTQAFSVLDWRSGKQYVLARLADMLEEACVSCEQEQRKARTGGPKGYLP